MEKFATYYRDGTTGLDYAKNRYYSSILGRFMTADPYMATASGANNPADPGSWNRYAYAGNDPVNFSDPSGLFYGCPSGDWAACGGGTDPGTGTGTSTFDPTLWNFVTHFSPSPETPKPPKITQAQKNAAKKEYDATRNDTLQVVKSALSDSDCRGLFGSGADPYAVLSDVLQGSGHYANFREVYWTPDSDGNITYGEVIKVPMFKASFRLNLIGWASNVDNGNTNQNAETLLHELGHVFSAVGYGSSIKQDIFGSKNSQYNDWLIDKDCFGGKLGYARP
jgi:RHS repeat-associated protein